MVWGIFYLHKSGLLIPTEPGLNVTAYISVVGDHVDPFIVTVYPSSNGYFQQSPFLSMCPGLLTVMVFVTATAVNVSFDLTKLNI